MNLRKKCFGQPHLAVASDCEVCPRNLRLACSLEQECHILALDHIIDSYGVLDQGQLDVLIAESRARVRQRLREEAV